MKLVNQQMFEGSGIEAIGMFDVLCGRDRSAFNNVGNRRFRVSVSLALDRYLKASTRKDKSIVIRSVVDVVRRNGGRFLQESRNQVEGSTTYIELDDKRSHEKTGHALRDMALLRGTKGKKLSSIQSVCPSTANSSVSSSSPLIVDTKMMTSGPSLLFSSAQPNENLLINPEPAYPTYCAKTEDLVDENWDDASELSSDESVFDDLVRLVAGAESTSKNALDSRTTPPRKSLIPVISDDAAMYSEQNEGTPLLHQCSVHPDQLIRETRLSNNSLVVDDRVLSWLVGEIDFV